MLGSWHRQDTGHRLVYPAAACPLTYALWQSTVCLHSCCQRTEDEAGPGERSAPKIAQGCSLGMPMSPAGYEGLGCSMAAWRSVGCKEAPDQSPVTKCQHDCHMIAIKLWHYTGGATIEASGNEDFQIYGHQHNSWTSHHQSMWPLFSQLLAFIRLW